MSYRTMVLCVAAVVVGVMLCCTFILGAFSVLLLLLMMVPVGCAAAENATRHCCRHCDACDGDIALHDFSRTELLGASQTDILVTAVNNAQMNQPRWLPSSPNIKSA